MKKLRSVLALCIGALLLSSCSLIPQSKGPVAIAKSKIPFGLLDKNVPGTKSSVQFARAPIYLVRAGHLVISRRVVIAPAQVVDVLNQLLLNLTPLEIAAHEQSAVPNGLQILQVNVFNGAVRVNLASSISAFTLIERPIAIAQIVLTAQAAGAHNGVIFAIEGVRQNAALPSGKTAGRVFAYEYSQFVN